MLLGRILVIAGATSRAWGHTDNNLPGRAGSFMLSRRPLRSDWGLEYSRKLCAARVTRHPSLFRRGTKWTIPVALVSGRAGSFMLPRRPSRSDWGREYSGKFRAARVTPVVARVYSGGGPNGRVRVGRKPCFSGDFYGRSEARE
jgi:hypothetical protein